MKKKYSFLALVFLIEVIIINMLFRMGIDLNALSLLMRELVLVILFIPLCTILYLISTDSGIKKPFRIISKIVMWHIIVCCALGFLVELIHRFIK